MRVSVVIPVYNAEQFVASAIESALAQPETGEVVIVEDGSPDNALEICQEYALREARVKLYRHPKGANLGAAASFNLGIRHAQEAYVAILGADDQYVPNAFKFAKKMFAMHSDADGVYAHIGVKYYDEEAKRLHLKRIPHEISGMFGDIAPEELLAKLIGGRSGHFSLDSLVMKRQILTAEYLFDEELRLGQDTDFIYRLSSAFRLYGPAETTIVALRGVHDGNRVWDLKSAAQYQRRLLFKCMHSNFYGCMDKDAIANVINRYLRHGILYQVPLVPLRIKRRLGSWLFLLTHPPIRRYVKNTRASTNSNTSSNSTANSNTNSSS
jgi:glycosyltransferase involved in cell wall biosynthesis